MDKQRVIIFSGPDGCGKTHMAKELSKRLGIPYFKNEGEWSHFEKGDDYFVQCMRYGDYGFFSQYLMQTGSSVILDRSWPSEWVYSRAFGRPTDDHVLGELDLIYSQGLGARIVLALRRDYSRVKDQFTSITPAKLEEIHRLYLDFAAWTRCPVQVVWVDDENLTREMQEILPYVTG